MDIAIAGGHGKIGRLLTRRLSADGHRVRAIIRNPEQAQDVTDDGATPVALDMESADAGAIAEAIRGCDGVVFAAGAGAGSGAARKETVDYGAAAKLVMAAEEAGVGRYVMVSSMGAENPPDGDDVFSVYLRAKGRADEALMDSGLAWTIVRPGRLTDDEATGGVTLDRHVKRGQVSRDDVAAVLAAVLSEPRTAGQIFEVVGGTTPVAEAVAQHLG
jgi:uncharacterized protein YbjT (DUF2867 family)